MTIKVRAAQGVPLTRIELIHVGGRGSRVLISMPLGIVRIH